MTTSVSLFISYIKTICKLLWRSVSSVSFYREVYAYYRGYGIKYILNLCLVASFFYTINLMYNISIVKDALVRGDNKSLEHLVSQIPEMKYNGSEIFSSVEMPYFINDLENRRVAVFDLNGTLSFSEKSKIPVVFTKNNLIIYITTRNKEIKSLSASYANFLGNDFKVITATSAREGLIRAFDIGGMFYALIIPAIAIFCFISLIFKLIVSVGIVYFLLKVYGVHATLKTVIRLCMFSSGAFVVSCSVIMLLFPEFLFLADVIHMIAGSLMLVSFAKGIK